MSPILPKTNQMASLKERVIVAMKTILKSNDGICGVGKGGYRTDRLEKALTKELSSDPKDDVLKLYDALKIKTPFKKVKNTDGKSAICYTPAADNALQKAKDNQKPITKVDIVKTIEDRLHGSLSKAKIELVIKELQKLITEHMTLPPEGPGMFELTSLFRLEIGLDEDESLAYKFVPRTRLQEFLDEANPATIKAVKKRMDEA